MLKRWSKLCRLFSLGHPNSKRDQDHVERFMKKMRRQEQSKVGDTNLILLPARPSKTLKGSFNLSMLEKILVRQ